MAKISYIINVLQHYSSKTNPLSIRQIMDYLNDCYGPFIDSSTTSRALHAYLKETSDLNEMARSSMDINYKIHVLYKNTDSSSDEKYIDVTSEYAKGILPIKNSKNPKRPKAPTAYFYYEPPIPEEEISNLINMVESHPYYTTEEVIKITNTLKSIAPAYFDNKNDEPLVVKNMRADNSTLQENLHDLHWLINEKVDIMIEYSYYDETKELIPHTGYPQRITPYQIVWANGYCYLIAYNPHHNNITHYRVDRITAIDQLDDKDGSEHNNIGPKNPVLHSINYAKAHPAMSSGETCSISLLCKRSSSIVNRLLDSFGMNTSIRPASPKRMQQVFPQHPEYNPNDWLDVTCPDINPYGTALWAKQYCTECVIYDPKDLAEKTKQELLEAANMYQ